MIIASRLTILTFIVMAWYYIETMHILRAGVL